MRLVYRWSPAHCTGSSVPDRVHLAVVAAGGEFSISTPTAAATRAPERLQTIAAIEWSA